MVQPSATRCSCIVILLSQSSEFCRHNPLCCFPSVYCCLFRYRISPETFGYTLVCGKHWVGIPYELFATLVMRRNRPSKNKKIFLKRLISRMNNNITGV
jgi:hypothetical protein